MRSVALALAFAGMTSVAAADVVFEAIGAIPVQAESIELQDGLAFVADGSAGLSVVDLSDPSVPAVVGSYKTTSNARDVAVDGGLVLVALANADVVILRGSRQSATPSAASPADQPPAWAEVPLPPGTYRQSDTAPTSHTVDIPVAANGGEIEYMVRMRENDVVVYEWHALEIDDVDRLTSEFHGHTDRAPGTTGTLVFYRQATGGDDRGSLVAPFSGTHGWYLKNDTARPVVVRLTLTGFYDVIPDQIPQ